MKTILVELPRCTIEEFADKNNLTMTILERPERFWRTGIDSKYYASFEHTEIKGDGTLIGTYGNGSSPELAIKDYAREISGKRIVLNAFSGGKIPRTEIDVPILVEKL